MNFEIELEQYLLKLESYRVPDRNGSCWRNEHMFPDARMRAINLGASGIALALIALHKRTQSVKNKHKIQFLLKETISWLVATSPTDQSKGFMTGDAGVALTVAVYAQQIQDLSLFEWSRHVLQNCLKQVELVDFFSGASGVIYAACIWLQLSRAKFDGESLFKNDLQRAIEKLAQKMSKELGVLGITDSSVDEGQSDIYMGVAHGSAGLYFSFYYAGVVLQSDDLKTLALQIRKTILAAGKTVNGQSLRYRVQAPDPANNLNWCHGVEGLIWSDLCLQNVHADESAWLQNRLLEQRRYDNATLCHGVAGRLEVLNALALNSPMNNQLKNEITHDFKALEILMQRNSSGLFWSSDDAFYVTPDLWVGFSGTFLSYCNTKYNWRLPLILSPQFFIQLSQADRSS
jgi:lantibiotic modifying enzyme